MVGAGDHGCWLGWYERDKAKLLAAALDTGSIFYDVGANVGFYSLLGAACVGSGGRVIAFEPVPENLLILQKHIAMSQLTNVTVIPAAVSDRCGAGRLQAGAANTTGCLSVDGDREVETGALDALVFERRLPVPQVIKWILKTEKPPLSEAQSKHLGCTDQHCSWRRTAQIFVANVLRCRVA